MRSPPDEAGRGADEGPQHLVLLGGFLLGKYEVPVRLYEVCQVRNGAACTAPSTADWDGSGWGVNRSADGRGGHPQNGLNWDQAGAYCAWVGGQLPSEAQWEYAAKGPVPRKYPWGPQPPDCTLAVHDPDGSGRPWGCEACATNGCSGTQPVGSRPAGVAWSGALDLAGNVWEWCQDWYHDSYTGAPADGTAWVVPIGASRVLRGGSFLSTASTLRSADRISDTPSYRYAYYGVRCSRPVP